MPSVFNSTPTFPRSQSSSNIHGLGSLDFKRPVVRNEEEIPRSASYSCLQNLEYEYTTDNDAPRLSARSQTDLSPEYISKIKNGSEGKNSNHPTKEERPKLERVGRRKSLAARPKSWIQRVKGVSPERNETSETANTTASSIPPVPIISKASRDKTKTVSETFATFAKKSWITTSRSPSPSRNYGKDGDRGRNMDDTSKNVSTVSSSSPRRTIAAPRIEEPTPVQTSDSPPKQTLRNPTTLSKLKLRPQSVLLSFTTFNSANSSTSSLPVSSTDGKSSPRTSGEKIPTLPKTLSTDKLQNFGMDQPRKKDELASAFKDLASDLTKFQAKSWSLKTNVVRSGLSVFLRNYATHPSNKNLRPEDLDRRVTILNKWWIAILEVLDGRQNQTVSGVDRPVLLDAVIGIMTRPEWRQSPSAFAPLSDRFPNHSSEILPLRTQKSSISLSSSASQFMAESVYHNVRNMFVQNLLSQMSYVVDKMSLRVTPPSLVTFCGKAAAYAYYFVPGVADILVRVWKLQAETIGRAADELGVPRRVSRTESDEVAEYFPSHIKHLAWTSSKSISTELRKKPTLSILASQINWYGHWAARWCGRDTDLFFVFTKQYHILAEEFLPSDLSFVDKCRAPGFLLIQAQLLTTFEATIHRQPPAEPLPITFDDVLSGADASATALPLSPSNNSARLMAENRLIMLLRDFISERPSDYDTARLTFAEAFSKMMQAGARRTSLYDHNACFVLCDFMEESLVIFLRFHLSHDLSTDFIDWPFWLNVCKKILESQNSMSEIRVFAFLFGAWNVIVNDERRKEVVCLDWLLTEETFGRFFNHWCPMVRAYYMRLLCWRICRDTGDASDLDTKIYNAASTLLKTNWAHYSFLKEAAERSNFLPPSTAPCHPAPGRRLLIIRNDTQSPAVSLSISLDGISASPDTPATAQATPSKRHSTPSTLWKIDTADVTAPKLTTDSPSTPNKKRWTFMGKFASSASPTVPAAPPTVPSALTTVPSLSATAPERSSSPNQARASSPSKALEALEEARRETARIRSRPALPLKLPSTDGETHSGKPSSYRAYSFKFSLEWSQHFEKAPNGSGNVRGGPGFNMGHERRISAPRLPAPAQAWLSSTVPGTSREVTPKDPTKVGLSAERVAQTKYSGRALAEWALIVGECNSFVERRRNEGVPALRLMEVPTLGVEGFRKFGASG